MSANHPIYAVHNGGYTVSLLGPLLPHPGYREGRQYMIVYCLLNEKRNCYAGLLKEDGDIEWKIDSDRTRELIHEVLPNLMNFVSVDVVQNC